MSSAVTSRRVGFLLSSSFVALVCVSLGAVPSAPTNLAAQVVGNTVALTWAPPASGAVLAYKIEAGSAPGLSNIVTAFLSPTPSLSVSSVPDGRYFVRVRAIDADGESQPSNEVIVLVGCLASPAAPLGLASSTSGGIVRLTWRAGGGCPTTNFVVVAGSTPGASDLAVVQMGASVSLTASAPPGIYYVRVIAQNAFGSSRASSEIVVQVQGVPSDVCRQVSAVLTPAPFGDPDKALMTVRYPTTLTGRALFDFTSYTRGAATWVEYDWWRQEIVLPNGASSISALIDRPPFGSSRLEFKCDGVLIASR